MNGCKAARTTLVFVNTRAQAEIVFQELWRLNEDKLRIALHHGSLAVEQRRKVEAAMVRGDLDAVVATSSLDLGVDWAAVDLVMQVGAPKGRDPPAAANRSRQPSARQSQPGRAGAGQPVRSARVSRRAGCHSPPIHSTAFPNAPAGSMCWPSTFWARPVRGRWIGRLLTRRSARPVPMRAVA